MPHLLLEYSENVVDPPGLRETLLQLHDALVDSAGFDRAKIKSRAVRHQVFAVGDGDPARAFVALEIAILEGREVGVKRTIAAAALAVLEAGFARAVAEGSCDLSVRVSEICRGSYCRGRLT